jgi:hypothetical protein
MNVVSVELLIPGLEATTKQRLETAIVGAVNTAMQRAVLAGCPVRVGAHHES